MAVTVIAVMPGRSDSRQRNSFIDTLEQRKPILSTPDNGSCSSSFGFCIYLHSVSDAVVNLGHRSPAAEETEEDIVRDKEQVGFAFLAKLLCLSL